MSIIFNNIGIAASIIAIPLAIAICIYQFYKTKGPKLSFEILSNVPIININERYSNVKILVHERDIQEQHEMLSVVTIKYVNNGPSHLTMNYYDENNLPRLICENGDFIEEQFLEKPEYVDNVFKEVDDRHFVFEKLLLDTGDYVLMKFLIQHGDDHPPCFMTSGRIVGQKKIPIEDLTSGKSKRNKESFMTRLIAYMGAEVIRKNVNVSDTLILQGIYSLRGEIEDLKEELEEKASSMRNTEEKKAEE